MVRNQKIKKMTAMTCALIFALALSVLLFCYSPTAAAADVPQDTSDADNVTVPNADFVYTITYDSNENQFVAKVEDSGTPATTLADETMNGLLAKIDIHAQTDWTADEDPVKKLIFGGNPQDIIDLGLNTLIFDSGTYIIDGNITSENAGTISQSNPKGTIYLRNNANVTMIGGTVENTGTGMETGSIVSFAVGCSGSSKFTITDGIIRNTAGTQCSPAIFLSDQNTLLTITGGNITSGNQSSNPDYSIPSGTIYSRNKADIKITGGTVESTANSWAIFHSGNVCTISGGTVKNSGAGGAIMIRYQAEVTVSGDTLITASVGATVFVRAKFVINEGIVENTGSGNAIRLAHSAVSSTDSVVEINGGTVRAAEATALDANKAGTGDDLYVHMSGGIIQSPSLPFSLYRGTHLTITGGTVENTRLTGNRRIISIRNDSTVTLGTDTAVETNLSFGEDSFSYDGTAKTLPLAELIADHFTVNYTDNVNAGTGSVTATANVEGCNAVFKANFAIDKAELSELVVNSTAVHTFGTAYSLSSDGVFEQDVVTYTIDTTASTGAGSISGNILTVTKAGKIVIVPSIKDKGNYEDITGTAFELTVNKGAGSGTVSLDGWKGKKVNNPVATSATNGVNNVTYEYKVKGADDNAYTSTVPTKAGEYTVRATFAATDNYNAFTAVCDFTVAPSLSGGAIAGIVIGSVFVVAIGGFAIFWFVIKKKTFAELWTVIKTPFAKLKRNA